MSAVGRLDLDRQAVAQGSPGHESTSRSGGVGSANSRCLFGIGYDFPRQGPGRLGKNAAYE